MDDEENQVYEIALARKDTLCRGHDCLMLLMEGVVCE